MSLTIDEPQYTDDGLIDTLDEFTPEGEEIPASYVEDGIRHIIVRDGDVELRYEWDSKQKKMKVLTDVF